MTWWTWCSLPSESEFQGSMRLGSWTLLARRMAYVKTPWQEEHWCATAGISNLRATNLYVLSDQQQHYLEKKCIINIICLNHPKPFPSPSVCEKLSIKLVPGTETAGECCSREINKGLACQEGWCYRWWMKVAHLCPALFDPMDCIVHGIL